MTFTECISMGGTLNECNTITEPTVSTLVVAVAIATLLLIATIIYKEVKK